MLVFAWYSIATRGGAPLCAPCGDVADGVPWTAVRHVHHVDGLRVAGQAMTRENRTRRTEHYLQRWEHSPEWNEETSAADGATAAVHVMFAPRVERIHARKQKRIVYTSRCVRVILAQGHSNLSCSIVPFQW